jgi:exonuclease III
MRVAAWNIQQGAPKRGGGVIRALLAHEPDLVVLTEFHPTRSGVIVEGLSKAGFRHLAVSEAGYGYQVLLASRLCLSDGMAIDPSSFPVGGYVQATIKEHDIVVAGVYVPVISAVPLEEKRRFWAMLHERAEHNRKHPYLVIGDWNTGDFPLDKESALRPFSCTREYRQMTELGFEEAWRTLNPKRREFTWWSNRGTGFRIDHAFVSPALRARLVDARYSHRERETKVSDHSVMIVDLAAAA